MPFSDSKVSSIRGRSMSEWLSENWKWFAAILVAGFIKPGFDYLKAGITGKAEAIHITASSRMDSLQISDGLLKQWMQTASAATERIARLEHCLWKLLPIVENAGVSDTQRHAVVEEVKRMLNEGHKEQ